MTVTLYTPGGQPVQYRLTWRTLGPKVVSRYSTEQACRKAAQLEADATGETVIIEQWSLDAPHDEANRGWWMVDKAVPSP